MESKVMNSSPDYQRGLSDGFKEGYNAALEHFNCLSQQHSIRIELSAEKLQEIKKEISENPMPILDFEEWKPIIVYDK